MNLKGRMIEVVSGEEFKQQVRRVRLELNCLEREANFQLTLLQRPTPTYVRAEASLKRGWPVLGSGVQSVLILSL